MGAELVVELVGKDCEAMDSFSLNKTCLEM